LGAHYTLPVTAYNRAGGMVLTVVNPTSTTPIIIEPVLSGNVLTIDIPSLTVLGQPATVAGLTLKIAKHGSAKKAYVTTPKTCPAGKAWPFKARFDYQDGTTTTLTSKSACVKH
ncbi:MAG TPA: hypothetical protein VKR21_05940, partial [Solirubrobacteraceae bacterium]|nr:hypothetical protein [Solirubrobacteraceae bacterium]